MITNKILKDIKQTGINIDHQMAFGGKSKGNKHLFRVVAIAKYLAEKEGANINLVEAAAWLHDTALSSGNDYEYRKNKKIALKLLSNFDIEKEEKNQIAECVASHEGTEIPKTLEAKIVHDADVLEKTGILGIIRHTWKLTNQDKINPDNISDSDIEHITSHIKWRKSILQTATARKLEKKNTFSISSHALKKLIPIISKQAKRSIITEKISLNIQPYLNKRQTQTLQNQLSLAYLK